MARNFMLTAAQRMTVGRARRGVLGVRGSTGNTGNAVQGRILRTNNAGDTELANAGTSSTADVLAGVRNQRAANRANRPNIAARAASRVDREFARLQARLGMMGA